MKKSILFLLLLLGSSTLIFAQKTSPLPPKKSTPSSTSGTAIINNRISDLKIAFVYTDSVINKYELFQNRSDIITQKGKRFDLDLQSKAKEFEQEIAIFEQRESNMTQNQASEKRDELIQKEQNLIDYKNKLMQELSDDESELLNEVYDRVQEFIKEYARENGIDLILSHTRGGAMWYGADAIDVTRFVVEGLNKEYNAIPAGVTPAPSSPGS
jgi:outer membrane protein